MRTDHEGTAITTFKKFKPSNNPAVVLNDLNDLNDLNPTQLFLPGHHCPGFDFHQHVRQIDADPAQ
jgi:hypothetical protein